VKKNNGVAPAKEAAGTPTGKKQERGGEKAKETTRLPFEKAKEAPLLPKAEKRLKRADRFAGITDAEGRTYMLRKHDQ
jgi:hypothetical protein